MFAAAARADGVTVTVIPAKLGLSATGEQTATVLVTNTSATGLRNLAVKALISGSSIEQATIKPAGRSALAAGASGIYQLTVGPWSPTPPAASLTVLASYRGKSKKSEWIPQAVTATVELTPPTPLEVDKAASVEVKASLSTLRTDGEEPVFLLVDNKSAEDLTVDEVIAHKPRFIKFPKLEEGGDWKPVTAGPGEVAVIELKARAASEVKPGEHQLVFQLRSRVGKVHFDLVGTQTAKVGVSGETELLTVFGIPSLLLLPGFLLLVTASVVWNLRWRRRDWDDAAFPLPSKEPPFWVAAVFFSLVIVLLARQVNTDLLGEYGLMDLAKIWLVSIVAGVVGCLLVIEIRNEWRARRLPNESDTPLQLLRKLARQKLSLRLPSVAGSDGARLFLVQPKSDTRLSTWTAPQIAFTWSKRDQALNERIQHHLDETYDADALAACLEQGENDKKLTVSWASPPYSPELTSKDKLADAASGEEIVKEAS